MTTSGSDDWSQTRDEIIGDALVNVGAIGPGDSVPDGLLEHGRRALDRVVKSIDADGRFLWRIVRRTTTTTDGTASFTLAATDLDVEGPMRFTQASATSSSPIERMTREEYMRLPSRTTESRAPVRFYVERDLTGTGRVQCTVYLWPVPSTTGDSIEYATFTRTEDFDTGAVTSDFPTSWIKCLVSGLSAELAPAYRQPGLASSFNELFEAERARLLNADNERGDLTFVPYGDLSSEAY